MIVIAIAGGTASGKTCFRKIVEHYKNFNVKYLSLDSFIIKILAIYRSVKDQKLILKIGIIEILIFLSTDK